MTCRRTIAARCRRRNLRDIYQLGLRHLYADGHGTPLFTDNETNAPRVYGPGNVSRKPYVKDAFHRYIVNGEQGQVNPSPDRHQGLHRLQTAYPGRPVRGVALAPHSRTSSAIH